MKTSFDAVSGSFFSRKACEEHAARIRTPEWQANVAGNPAFAEMDLSTARVYAYTFLGRSKYMVVADGKRVKG